MHYIAEKMAALRRAVKKHVEQVKKLFQSEKATSDMSHLLLLGKFEYGGGPIFKVVLEC